MLRKRSSTGPSPAAKRRAILDQRSQMAAAATIIRKSPALRGYARTAGDFRNVSRAASGELKFFDNTFSDLITTTGTIKQLLTIPQDATQSGRVGRRINVRKIVYNLSFVYNVTGAASSIGCERVRFLIVHDKQCNGAAADWASVANGVMNVATPDALRNLDNVARFQVLADKDIVINSQAGVSGAWQQCSGIRNGVIPCNIPIEYDNSVATGAITSIRSSNIFAIAICQATTNGTSLLGQLRIRYTD